MKHRRAGIFLILIAATTTIAAQAFSAPQGKGYDSARTISAISSSGYTFPQDLNPESAIEVLSKMPLTGPEGLWHFEPDEVTLMILRDDHSPGRYDVFVIDAVDCRLYPGMKIGSMESSVDSDTFRLRLFSQWKKNSLGNPLDGIAKFNHKEGIIKIEGKSAKLSLSPSIVLPNLLSLLRLRINLKYNDPTQKLPAGLRRLYPGTPGRLPIYL